LLAKKAANGKVKDEVLDREDEVPETRTYFGPCLVGRTSPSAQRRLHADQNVMDGTFGLGIREKHVAIG
jgi:hypothetical protein